MEAITGMFGAVASGGISFFALILLGVFVGMLVGVLPGLTFVMGVLLILPFTYTMDACLLYTSPSPRDRS